MSTIEPKLREILVGLDDELLTYIASVVDDMPASEVNSPGAMGDAIGPFLLDSGFCGSQTEVDVICGKICSSASTSVKAPELEEPTVFATAFKMKAITISNPEAVLASLQASSSGSSAVPFFGQATIGELEEKKDNEVKDARRRKKEDSTQRKAMEREMQARQLKLNEMKVARMAAIRASRGFARQASSAVILDKFTVPHPAGMGDILAESNVTLVPRHRYGFIGKNGIGKSTVMNCLAAYKTPQISHLRINLVDQHIEGDDRSPMQVP